MPCYNERATLQDIVERVLASPYTAEVVIVDDGSTDGSRDIAAKLADTDGAGSARRRRRS
jgi:glycosyltransferase involved in cell wall biosynthesis